MTELSNDPPIPETDQEAPEQNSPWIMLTSMLLLIAGLILTSAMLIHYAPEHSSGEQDGPRSEWSQLLEKGKTLADQAQAKKIENKTSTASVEKTKPGKTEATGIKRFFTRDNSDIRWPKLKLTGFGKSADGEGGFGIINEKHILKGQEISGAKLVEIRAHGVVLEYKGERKVLAGDPTR